LKRRLRVTWDITLLEKCHAVFKERYGLLMMIVLGVYCSEIK
jgi:hypothetical protein